MLTQVSSLELGAGGGLVGLALSLFDQQNPNSSALLPYPILLTDIPALLPLQSHNIALNDLPSSSITSLALPWGSIPSELPDAYCHPDVILAADCVYFEPAFPLLLETLSALLGSKNGEDGVTGLGEGEGRERDRVCYFCMKKRRKADMRFVKELRKKFEVVEIREEIVAEEKGVFLCVSTPCCIGSEKHADFIQV